MELSYFPNEVDCAGCKIEYILVETSQRTLIGELAGKTLLKLVRKTLLKLAWETLLKVVWENLFEIGCENMLKLFEKPC